MKAVVFREYGTPASFRIEETEKPVPAENEVLIKVYASSINSADWRILRADPFLIRLQYGIFNPGRRIPGCDIAGRIESVGSNVTRFHQGDEVYGDISESGFGGFAEYVCAPENTIAQKPSNLSFEEAAAVPAAANTALQGLRDHGQVQPGQKVLINGASGGVGTYAIQIAKALGAEVTAVCSPGNTEKARSLGADHVIDYTKEDFTKNGRQYDLIFAVNGYHSIFEYRRSLTPSGKYVMAGGSGKQIFQTLAFGPWLSVAGKKKMGTFNAVPNRKDLEILRDYVETGAVIPVIERRWPLEKASDAICYFSLGHARGKIVIITEQTGREAILPRQRREK